MSIDSRAKHQYAKAFGNWEIGNRIGHGSQGKSIVYKITKSNYTYEEDGALKIMNIMEQTGDYSQLSDDLKEMYDKKCLAAEKRAETEIQTMYQLKNNDHIVSCLDHRFERWEDEDSYGEDLLIRMDLYESIGKNMGQRIQYEESEIIRIGKDICIALIACHETGILHRDIKPDNIFKSANGNYLLGDFGVARMTEHTLHAETMIGSYPYAAPEQMGRSGASGYDERIDIYGLGLTLYELANEGRRPFAASEVENDTIEYMLRRLSGEKLPRPSGVGDALAQVILRACAYNPQDRYPSANVLYQALDVISTEGETASALAQLASIEETLPAQAPSLPPQNSPDLEETLLAESNMEEVLTIPAETGLTAVTEPSPKPRKKKIKGLIFAASVLAIACITVFLLSMRKSVVPDFCYVSKRHALKLAGENDLQIKWEKDYSSKIEKGRVIKQSVKSGEKIKRNSTITLVLSKGKKLSVVSDFTNKTWEEAQAEAEKIHVKLSKKEEGSLTVESGRVILQSIQPGSEVEENSTIELVVSVGPHQVSVPQLVGLTEADAMQLCAKNGLEYKKIDQYGTSVDPGKIMAQHVDAGKMVLIGTCIEVDVCIGAPPPSKQEVSEPKEETASSHTVVSKPTPAAAPAPSAEPTPAPSPEPASIEEPAPVSEPAASEEPFPVAEPTLEPEEPSAPVEPSEPEETSETDTSGSQMAEE